jgi:hypothetical protein
MAYRAAGDAVEALLALDGDIGAVRGLQLDVEGGCISSLAPVTCSCSHSPSCAANARSFTPAQCDQLVRRPFERERGSRISIADPIMRTLASVVEVLANELYTHLVSACFPSLVCQYSRTHIIGSLSQVRESRDGQRKGPVDLLRQLLRRANGLRDLRAEDWVRHLACGGLGGRWWRGGGKAVLQVLEEAFSFLRR